VSQKHKARAGGVGGITGYRICTD